jgi:hypothetical protein
MTGTFGQRQEHVSSRLDCAPCLARTCRLTSNHTGPAPCLMAVQALEVWRRVEAAIGLVPPVAVELQTT